MPPDDDRLNPIPLAVLTGFLGAGKTSRLNTWLKDPAFADTLVIINEIGAVGLDHLLIEEVAGDMLLMAAGCLCCSLRGDLVATLEDLLRRRDNNRIRLFRRVIIETTGLADPAPVLQAVLQHPYLAKRFAISSVLTLVDVVNGAASLENHPEARRQIALADAIILTKTDIATPAARGEARAAISRLNPRAPVLDAGDAASPETLLAPRFDPAVMGPADLEPWLGPDMPATAHGKIDTFAIISQATVSMSQLIVFREAMRVLHGPKLLRMKGIVGLTETPEAPVIIHQVQSVLHPPLPLPRWPSRDRRTRLVFIGDGLSRGNVEAFWRALA